MRRSALPVSRSRPRWARSAFLGLTLLLAACGGGMQGIYEDELGVTRYEFKSDGSIVMTVMGVAFEGEYEIEGDRIVVFGPNGRLGLRRSGDVLVGPMGLVLRPVADG